MTQAHDTQDSDARIASLEQQVRRLEALVEGRSGAPSPGQAGEQAYDRRALLRRGGAVLAAGAAGAVAIPALAGSAAAADGANLVLGSAATNSEATPTALTRSVNDGGPNLILGNGTAPASGRTGLGSPTLRLTPSAYAPDPSTPGYGLGSGGTGSGTLSGDFFVQAGSGSVPTQLLFTHESPTTGANAQQAAIGSVYTDYLANLFVGIKQDSSARAFHQVIGAKGVAQINLQPFLAPSGFLVAAIGVLQVANTQGGAGYLTLYPTQTARPSVGAITWAAANSRLSTLAVALPGGDNKVNVYANVGAEVFFDIVGLLVPSPASVASAHLPSTFAASNRVRSEKIRAQHTARF
jgi:hypothetical protein